MSRIETGVVQFDDDWPGVFIRGDNAFGYAMTVKQAAEAIHDPSLAFLRLNLAGLAELLASCQVKGGQQPEGTQHVIRAGVPQEKEPKG